MLLLLRASNLLNDYSRIVKRNSDYGISIFWMEQGDVDFEHFEPYSITDAISFP